MESIGSTPESVANAFLRVMNRHDVSALVALMTPGHRFVDSLGNTVEGPREVARRLGRLLPHGS